MSICMESKSDTAQGPTVKRSRRGFRRWLANAMFGRHSSDLVLKRSAGGGKADFLPANNTKGGSGDQPLKQIIVTPGQEDSVIRINALCGFKPLLPPTAAPVTGTRRVNGLALFQGYHDNIPASHADDISVLITYSQEAAGPDAVRGPSLLQFSPGEAMMPYTVRDLIGYGGQGVVYTATQDDTAKVVVKLARKAAWIGLTMNEFILLKDLQHPNVVQAVSPVRGGFVMELVHTDLASLLDAGTLSSQARLRLTAGVVAGLGYIHAQGVAHLDIKPSNVLLDRQFSPKLADFGLSARFLHPMGKQRLLQKVVGTPAYMAPEVLRFRSGVSRGVPMAPVDVWACGCLMYELLTGTVPFGDNDMRDIHRRQMALATQRLKVPTNTAPYIRDDRIAARLFMATRLMLDIRPDRRPTAALIARLYCGGVK